MDALILLVGLACHHSPVEVLLLGGLLTVAALAARWLARDLRLHPAGFPEAPGLHGEP